MHSSYVQRDAEPGLCAQNAVSGRLTGRLLESFGRVDDHMQKAVQARSLLIWKTSTTERSESNSWCSYGDVLYLI